MLQITLTPEQHERARTIKTNLTRSGLNTQSLADHFGTSRNTVQDVLKGLYNDKLVNERLGQYEQYLQIVLGARYVHPYFDDLRQ